MSTTSATPTEAETDTPNSASDSLNSLLPKEEVKPTDCDTCEVHCSLASQCAPCDDGVKIEDRERRYCCNTVAQCVWGVALVLMSISGFLFTPQDIMLKEKLNMRPGFPPFEWWRDPPDEVRLRVYVFTVTNHERFMAGRDAKMHLREIGPVVYLEKLVHSNIRFNDNSTMSYKASRMPIFLPEDNTIDLNQTIVVPNLALLGISSYLHNANYIVRSGFRFLVNSHRSQYFVNKTIYEYLWDFRDPVLETSRSLAPGMIPVTNMGMLSRIYGDFVDDVTVQIGPQYGHSGFFQIDKFRGQPQIPGYDPNVCPDRIYGSTEGVMYHQHLKKSDVLLYWRKTVCKLMPLHFDSELVLDDVPVYRYNLSENVYDRVKNGTDCYNTDPSLPDGISDASKCYFDFPMVVSYPHFYTGSPPKDEFVTGLSPDRLKHNSYIIVEPITGIPFRSVARMQSNLRVHDLSGFSSEYTKFSNLIIPLFWAEYNQKGLPTHIRLTIYFMTTILPPLSTIMFILTLLLGCYFLGRQMYVHKIRNESLDSLLRRKSENVNALAKNKIFSYEKDTFLKVPR